MEAFHVTYKLTQAMKIAFDTENYRELFYILFNTALKQPKKKKKKGTTAS
jgi:hypothetical protein